MNRKAVFWGVKYIIFNLMYLPMLFGFQKLLFGSGLTEKMLLLFAAAGQVGFFLYDRAYEYVQGPRFRQNKKTLQAGIMYLFQ